MSTLRTLSEEFGTKLEPAIKSSFGIKGRPIMITQNSPKQIRVTKDGLDICNSFLGHVHPLLNHILQHIRNHHHILQFCDGSKTIVLKVASLIRVLDKNLGNISSSSNDRIQFLGSLSRELDRFRSRALPKIVESLRIAIFESADTSLLRDPESLRKFLIQGFLNTRLNPTVARNLVPLLVTYFREVPNAEEKIEASASASQMGKPTCLAISNASVDESIYVPGFPIVSNGPKRTIPDKILHTLLIWMPQDVPELESVKFDLAGSSSSIVDHELDWKRKLMDQFLTDIQRRFGITLVLCTFSLPSFAKSMLSKLQMTALEHIPEIECQRLADNLGILPWRGPCEGTLCQEIASVHVVSLKHSIASKILGSTWLHLFPLPNQSAFILCGPTSTLANFYKSSVEQCLNLVQASHPWDETNVTKQDMDKEMLSILMSFVADAEFEVLHSAFCEMLKEHIWFKKQDLPDPRHLSYYDSLSNYVSQLNLILDILKRIVTIHDVVFLRKLAKTNKGHHC